MGAFDDALEAEVEAVRAEVEAELEAGPWWCPICGANGNGYQEGEPAWHPPADHECGVIDWKLTGFRSILDPSAPPDTAFLIRPDWIIHGPVDDLD